MDKEKWRKEWIAKRDAILSAKMTELNCSRELAEYIIKLENRILKIEEGLDG